MRPPKYILSILLLTFMGCTQNTSNELDYIDKTKPNLNPLLFAEEFITKDSVSEFGSIFNKKNDEFYYAIDSANRASIKYTKYLDGKWINPITILSDSTYSFNDPFLSNDENRLYYISNRPKNRQDTIEDYDIWYSQKIEEKWSEPINVGTTINTDANEYYISFSESGTMYFASNKEKRKKKQHDFDIYKSEVQSGKFLTPEKLSNSINSKWYEADVFISPDESYMIYCSERKTGFGKGDLYISFKDDHGNWTQSINMGEPINSEEHELCPFVTKDGLYFFYTSNQNINWVSTDVIKSIKEKSR